MVMSVAVEVAVEVVAAVLSSSVAGIELAFVPGRNYRRGKESSHRDYIVRTAQKTFAWSI